MTFETWKCRNCGLINSTKRSECQACFEEFEPTDNTTKGFQSLKSKLVNGYLRELNKTIQKDYIIPSLVSHQCLVFYVIYIIICSASSLSSIQIY